MTGIETAGVWVAIFMYAASGVLYTIGLIFGREANLRRADIVARAGVAGHVIGIMARWWNVGHGPYLGFYEIASLMALLSVTLFLFIIWRQPGLRVAGIAIMPITFLMLGGSMLATKEAMEVSGSLASFWLLIHVAFANLAYGAYVAAFALSAGFLIWDYGHGQRMKTILDKLPAREVLDDMTYRFVGAGFLFQGVMIASGAIWANEAWGRYWAWDPMETWSLLAWLVYAIYLHLRLTLGWQGRRAAWVAVVSLPVIVFSLLGVPIVYKSIHAAYLVL